MKEAELVALVWNKRKGSQEKEDCCISFSFYHLSGPFTDYKMSRHNDFRNGSKGEPWVRGPPNCCTSGEGHPPVWGVKSGLKRWFLKAVLEWVVPEGSLPAWFTWPLELR